jgi:hypothetical protein
MKQYMMIIIASVIVVGCGSTLSVAPAPTTTPVGGNFLPLYLDIISGKKVQKNVCEAHTLEQLLLPCEYH